MTRASILFLTVALGSACLSGMAAAAEIKVPINKVSAEGVGDAIGNVVITESDKGLALKVDVTGIPAGPHGFHIHEKPDCSPGMKDGKTEAAMAAGPHYDPAGAKSHKGPQGAGHGGDLPLLTATDLGISMVVNMPKLKLADVRGRSLMIHEGGDNYTDTPENGGGKGRIACGIIAKE